MPTKSSPDPELDFGELRAANRRDMNARLKRLGADRGLTPDQQARLVDIVIRCSAAFSLYQDDPNLHKRLREDAKLGAASRRMFKSKIAAAVKALDDALNYVAEASRRNELFGRALRDLATPRLQEARKAFEAIRMNSPRLTTPTIERLTPLGKSFGKDPNADARKMLSTFFDGIKNVRKHDADHRIGLIGNDLGWWKVKINNEWIPIEDRSGARGSTAIRKSRLRSKRRDTSRKTR